MYMEIGIEWALVDTECDEHVRERFEPSKKKERTKAWKKTLVTFQNGKKNGNGNG